MGNTKAVGVSYSDPDFDSMSCSGSFLLGGSTFTSADVTTLAGVTPGTAAASKALVLNSSKGISTITSATITTLTSTTVNAGTLTNSTASGRVVGNAAAGLVILSTAITANSTTTSEPAGSLGITTNATGLGKLFYADGTKWQFMAIS